MNCDMSWSLLVLTKLYLRALRSPSGAFRSHLRALSEHLEAPLEHLGNPPEPYRST